MAATLVGVGLDIPPAYAERAAVAHMRACAGEVCREADVSLFPSSSAVPAPCTGEVCSARMTPTGGKHGFLDVPGLTDAPLRVSVTLRDAGGAEVLVRDVDVTPKASYPNGPDCGMGGYQANVAVAADGSLTPR